METLLIILIIINAVILLILVFTYVIFLLNSMFPEKYFKKTKKKNSENIRLQYFNDNISYQGVIYKVNSEEYLSIRVLQDGTFINYRVYGNKKRNLIIYKEQLWDCIIIININRIRQA